MAPQESTRTEAAKSQEAPALGAEPATCEPYKGELVISGISGRYPSSDNMKEFETHLYNKTYMVSDEGRWENGYWDLPSKMGKVKDIASFDTEFFGISPKACDLTDPQQRVLLEVAYEAIIDAGLSLESIKGSRTGVYIGIGVSDAEDAWVTPTPISSYAMQGTAHAIAPNRISFTFDLHGPSCSYDTACSTSLVALEAAECHMRSGVIDRAIVGAVNFLSRPSTTWHFKKLNMMSNIGCQAFDAAGDGFVRSEGCGAFVLERAAEAKRSYATVMGTLSNCDGWSIDGLLFPNTLAQEQLIRDVYHNFNIDPNDLAFFDCHGTGTPAGDPVEANAITRVICEKRKEPLTLVSTKDTVGHCEIASGLASISRTIITLQNAMIPANIHFKNPNQKIPALLDGRLVINKEAMPIKDGSLVSINSFGMTGTNGHTVLRGTNNRRTAPHPASDKPRLFIYGARTEEGINNILDEAHKYADNVDFHALAQESANPSVRSMPYRGATILNAKQTYRETLKVSNKKREVWFVYAGMGCQWIGMGRQLMELEVFRKSIEETAGHLKPLGVDLLDLLLNTTQEKLETQTAPFICINAIQIGITDLLFSMDIKPDGILGHSLGEVGAGYADGCMTKREAILAAYYRGHVMVDTPPPPGQMAAVGMTWEEARARCPPGVIVACHNGEDSVTISGEAEATRKWMKELADQGVFVREVNSNGIAYHSPQMKEYARKLGDALAKEVTPKPRSKRWISTSIPEEDWNSPSAKMCGPEYHANNMGNVVLFYEGLQKIPENAIVIEIAPAALFQSILKKTIGEDCVVVGLQKRGIETNLDFFYSSLGNCYVNGLTLNPLKVLPPVEFPVPIGTPMISPMISTQWDHRIEWPVPSYKDFEKTFAGDSGVTFEIDASEDGEDRYLNDHALDGKALFPGVGSVVLAWKALAKQKNVDFDQLPVQLTNVQIHQAMFLQKSGTSTVSVNIKPSNGEFTVADGESILATGFVNAQQGEFLETDTHTRKNSCLDEKSEKETLTSAEVYRELICRGYEYGPAFQGIRRASVDGNDTDIRFDGRWISYLDSALQMIVMARRGEHQMLPTKFDVINIDPTRNPPAPREGQETPVVPGRYDPILETISVGGVEIKGITTIRANRRLTHSPSCQEHYEFVPFTDVREGERTCGAANQDVQKYANAMAELARQGMTAWLAADVCSDDTHKVMVANALTLANKTSMGTADYAAAKAALTAITGQKNGHKLPNTCLSELLYFLLEEPHKMPKAIFLETLHDFRYHLWDDIIFQTLERAEIVKSFFDTIAENVNKNVVDVLEVGSRKGAWFRQALPKALDYLHIHDYKYTVADKVGTDDAEDYAVKQARFDFLDPDSFPESYNESCDVLVMKQALHYQIDLDAAISGFDKMVRPGGFIFIQEYVRRLQIPYALEAYVHTDLGGKDAAGVGERILGTYYSESQWRDLFARHGYEEIFCRPDGVLNTNFLFRKRQETSSAPLIVRMDDYQCSWLEELQAKFTKLQNSPDDARLWLVGTSDYCGLIGLVASMRWAPGSEKVRCIQVSNHKAGSSMPDLTADSAEFKALQKKDLTFNIYRDGRWGTYTGLSVSKDMQLQERPREHVFADCLTDGDMTSLKWFDSPLNIGKQNGKVAEDTETCDVYYAGLNHRDVVLANGSRKKDELPIGMLDSEGIMGVEFAGRDSSGRKTMGLCAPPALASTVRCANSSLWSVPDTWSLEDAATVPLAYSLAYYALVSRARLRNGQKVFVQAGWTAVGQAAIAVCQSKGCEVFTLSRSSDETALLRSLFPKLTYKHICSANDVTFKNHILVQTGGKGVDVVFSSLTGDVATATQKLVANRGCFLDVGFGSGDGAPLGLATSLRGFSIERIDLDSLIDSQGPEWTEVRDLVQSGIKSGVVKPLTRKVFAMENLVEAFKAVDDVKVVIQVREEERQRISPTATATFPAVYRTSFNSQKSYVIIGGLGGLGLETADWMVTRGARKFVLTSRSGITTGFQVRKIDFLRSRGAQVEIVALNINSDDNVDILVGIATNLGPIGGLFNMGLVLNDFPLLDHTHESFMKALDVKITTTLLLDRVSREAPVRTSLDHFVLFSSVTGSDGNIGQTNYAFGNSFMERLVERRRLEGLPGFAVEMGPVADTGAVGQFGNDGIYCAKAQQRLFDVKVTFDYMLSQDHAIVKTYVIPEKQNTLIASKDESVANLISKLVGKILGVKDVNTVDGDKEFFELGMDSLMSVEIKQMLERDVGIVTTVKDLQLMTFNLLKETVETQT